MFKVIAAMIDFALAGLNVVLAVIGGNAISWWAAAFCFVNGIAVLLIGD